MPLDSSQYLNPSVQVLRVSAALAALGALDATPLTMPVEGWTELTLLGTYTRAAAGGSVRLVIEFSFSPAPTVWYQTTIYDAGAFVAGADVRSALQAEEFVYASTAAGAERFMYQLEIPSNAEYVRVACAELGAIANPGTFALTGVASY